MFAWVRKVGTATSRAPSFIRRRARGLPLLPTVLLAIGGGVVLAVVAELILNHVTHVSAEAAKPIDVTKLAFSAVAGVGGVVALVVAYRRQRDIEQGRFIERFGAAAAQLGASDVAVRIAGVYAMAGVADEATGIRRQQCIDVLCGYLRLPYSPELGSNHQSKLVLTEARSVAGARFGQQERHLEYRQNDKEVRKTIVRVIADRLRNHEYSWSACDFDFRTAHLEDVDFSRAVFDGTTRFDAARFTGAALFNEATFSDDVWFDEATFSSTAAFWDVTLSGAAVFDGATFSGRAVFYRGRFAFGAAFSHATFCGAAVFDGARFGRKPYFVGATFSDGAGFDLARLSDGAEFHGARFSDGVAFSGLTISGDVGFEKVAFAGHSSFAGTDFGTGTISFENPRQWGPPAPRFDWDSDFSTKPQNVKPPDWPPTPIAEG